VLSMDAVGLGKRGITGPIGTDDACGNSHLSKQGKPYPVVQTRGICSGSRDGGGNLTIAQKEGTPVLVLTKVIMGVMAADHMERVVRLEPFIKVACWWHTFPI